MIGGYTRHDRVVLTATTKGGFSVQTEIHYGPFHSRVASCRGSCVSWGQATTDDSKERNGYPFFDPTILMWAGYFLPNSVLDGDCGVSLAYGFQLRV